MKTTAKSALLGIGRYGRIRPYTVMALGALSVSTQAQNAPEKPLVAFPGAEGFGALATGGRGGEVYHVTNLNDSGPGSFRDAVSQPKRTVVFDVGGVIRIKKPISVKSDLTIAGQTAPGDGITIYGEGVSFSGSRNVIARYLRLRQGIAGRRGGKSLNLTEGSDMIFDHLSVQWGRWDSMGMTKNALRVTLQNSIVGEAIDPQRFGALFDGAREITLVRNLWLNNQSRNPKLKGDIQYINNIVYNWGASGVIGGHSAAVWKQDMINNLLMKGPSSNDKALDMWATSDSVYQQGNVVDLTPDGKLEPRPVVETDFRGETPPTFRTEPIFAPPIAVTIESVEQTLARIIADAGASLPRDAVDTRLISQLQSLGTAGAISRREDEVGGQPISEPVSRAADFDTDSDGISDEWEKKNGLDSRNAADSNTVGASGYTRLEEYLNSLAKR